MAPGPVAVRRDRDQWLHRRYQREDVHPARNHPALSAGHTPIVADGTVYFHDHSGLHALTVP